MIDQQIEKSDSGVSQQHISGDLWRVGFTRQAFSLMGLMSGLVEIVDTFWEKESRILVFIVRNRDATGVLFRKGFVKAKPLPQHTPVEQPVYVP